MAWLGEDEFRELYVTASATEISSAQVEQCLDAAIDKLGDMCGDSVADEIESAENTLRKAKSFRRAQGKLAYAELLLLMSSRFRNGGILVKESDANASVTDEYVSFSDIEKRRAALIGEAVEAVRIYLTPQEKQKEDLFFMPSISIKKNITW